MPNQHRNRVIFLCILLLSIVLVGKAQDVAASNSLPLITYIQELEEEFDIKFSYVDEDLRPIRVTVTQSRNLETILSHIRNETQLIIKKLSERYYTLSKSSTVDICALVLDNFEQNTVIGASVEVLGSSIATATSFNGGFAFENIPRKAVVRIRHLGYRTLYVTAEELVSKEPCHTLLLGVRYQQLEEVVVFNLLTTGITKQLDASIQIKTADFGMLPGLIEPDVLQTVQALPGIKSIDESVSDINIRGGTNDQNLLLWDGIKMYQSGHFFGLISAFNPYLTDNVTIIKNGTSAQYGEGVSGIIDMRTTDEVGDHFFGGAGINLISGDIYGHVPLRNDLAFQFSARRSVTDFLNTPTYDQFFDRAFQDTEVIGGSNQNSDEEIIQDATFYFYDFTGKILYDINDRHKLRLSFININNILDFTETNQGTSRTNKSTLDQDNISFGGHLDSDWTTDFSTRLSAYYTRYNLDATNSSDNGQQQLFQNNEVYERSFKLNSKYQLNEALAWYNGYQFTETGITNIALVTQPPFESRIKGVIHAHSPFSELNYMSPNQKFRIIGGMRFNYIENLATFNEIIVEPRLNINYALTRNLRLEFLGEFKNQTTNQIIDLEQNFLGIEKRRWVLSDNQELPVTKSKQASAGITFDRENWFVGLEGFYKEVTGISTATQGFQNEDQFNGEIGQYAVKGVEFLINHKNKLFSTWLSYAFNNNTYTFEDITPNSFPNNLDIKHTATLATTYVYNKLKVGAGLNYRSGKPFTEPVQGNNAINTTVFPNTINYQEPNSSRLPDYLRMDASASYDFDISRTVKASAAASVLNVLNKKNLLNTYYRLNDQDEIEKVESKSLGLTPNLSFRISF